MSTVATIGSTSSTRSRLYLVVAAAIAGLATLQFLGTPGFPESWYIHLADPVNDAKRWIVHRGSRRVGTSTSPIP